MSGKTRTRKPHHHQHDRFRPTLRSVPGHTTAAKARTDAEDKLWTALWAHPNSTTADLSTAAKIGKSTAQKILVRWASDGSVTRTAGIAKGGRRADDLWAIAEADTALVDDAPADAGDQDDTRANNANTADTAQAAPDSPDKPGSDRHRNAPRR